jgi:REP element-mobilizing transposase RayT
MEDHLHLLLEGRTDDSDFKSTMTVLRQRTANAYGRARGERLWQDGYYDRVLRPSDDVFAAIRYILGNPKKAELPEDRRTYPYVWSDPNVNG